MSADGDGRDGGAADQATTAADQLQATRPERDLAAAHPDTPAFEPTRPDQDTRDRRPQDHQSRPGPDPDRDRDEQPHSDRTGRGSDGVETAVERTDAPTATHRWRENEDRQPTTDRPDTIDGDEQAAATRTRKEALADFAAAEPLTGVRRTGDDPTRGAPEHGRDEPASGPEGHDADAADALDPETARFVADYIDQHKQDRPWLAKAEGEDPLVQYVYVARDQSGGHDLRRHEGFRGDEGQAARTRDLQDPAHAQDSLAYTASTDALKPGDPDTIGGSRKQHSCDIYATHIPNAAAWATAVARIHQHPRIQEALATPSDQRKPSKITDIPIQEILGPAGHTACHGYQLVTEGFNSRDEARDAREDWVREVRREMATGAADRDHATERVRGRTQKGALASSEPQIEPIPSFAGGHFCVTFRHRADGTGYEVSSIYVNPPSSHDKDQP